MSEQPTETKQATEKEPEVRPDEPHRPWLPSPPQIQRYKSAEDLAQAAAKRFLDTAKRAVDKSDQFIVVLAGGGHTDVNTNIHLKSPSPTGMRAFGVYTFRRR